LRTTLAVFLLIGLLSAVGYGADKVTIAIMDFESRDVPRTEALKISELIRNEMVNSGQYTVLERTQVDKILHEQGFQMTGCTDVTCAVQVGKLLSARKILVGTVMKFGDNIAVTGRVVDVEKGIAEFAEKERAISKDDVFYMVERFCDKLTMRITGKPIYKKDAASNKYTMQGGTKFYGSYDPLKDPTAWIALGTGLASGAGFIAGYAKYQKRMDDERNLYSWYKQKLFLLGAITFVNPLIVFELNNNFRSSISQAEKSRNYVYIASGAIGAVAFITFFTFISHYVDNIVAVNNNDHVNTVAVFIPPQYFNPMDWTKRNGFGFGLGLTMKL
jgi:TolB-like protein